MFDKDIVQSSEDIETAGGPSEPLRTRAASCKRAKTTIAQVQAQLGDLEKLVNHLDIDSEQENMQLEGEVERLKKQLDEVETEMWWQEQKTIYRLQNAGNEKLTRACELHREQETVLKEEVQALKDKNEGLERELREWKNNFAPPPYSRW
ncbi:hypothetical protein V5O48_012874 [Marasmius crinis-equi]|uniref:Uncharacterized protein n=1 Tax=Marasmius crinis-equi TaxID=585013 RepID=A0ABR3F1M2_9AGAR